MKKAITNVANAPKPSGSYSPAIQVGNTLYLAGQIPLVPATGEMVADDFSIQVRQVFENMQAVCLAAGGNLNDVVKLNIYLTDLSNFPYVNQIMPEFFNEPYPARTTIEVSALPKNAQLEIDGILVLA
ncbi:MAG: RidA family protein [Gammaproteobacteria bacterium]|jgi:reactive intermediate/imine deaminase|nr:RidA family protein [Gammaproteobacteria bacterium]